MTQAGNLQGIHATLPELIRARPARKNTGFAPGGRVTTHQWGANRSVFRGRGMEFDESRSYQPGDDVRAIDWRVTARTGTVHTKQFHEERDRPVHLLLDLRPMMRFGTRVRFKAHLAAEIAAMLAWVGHDGGDSIGGFILAPSELVYVAPTRTRRGLLSFLERIVEIGTAPGTEPATPPTLSNALHRTRRTCRPGTLVFVISDYADYDDTTDKELRRLGLHTHVTNIFVSDPLDAVLPPAGGRLTDGERAVRVAGLGRRALDSYALSFAERQARVARAARRRGMAFHTITTPDDPKTLLHPDIGQVSRKARLGRKVA
ncbi:DUF58 domain-containing protein [Aquicoccus sp. G2-2]|uniref:DUF58 domain-containing protein n=1 Tax=Aquicoccus sp. G2-2 TaxID=3092120 RepID=UPI002ADF1FD3|nr:DUF58 domain-containing protein [Aquicoccus sp. G2-2]MEA1114857.1 DUF58 domain-containing protein [Aquicoccus sp. G2-2]